MKSCLNCKNFFVIWVFLAVLGLTAGVANGRTINVRADGNGDYPTIQDAINDSNDGDIIACANGVYTGPGNRDIDFLGKAITVRSENGPNNCIIDCQNSGCAFYFESGEDANSIVEGFTLTNGDWGGIYCRESSPTITNCIISGNSSREGGGICCWESSPTITNCTITGNSARGKGGGIFCLFSSPTITNCTITGNSSDYEGGGIAFSHGRHPTITNCTISGNSTGGDGGAIFFSPHYEDDTLTITGSTITGNSAGSGGGAIACYESSATITDCTISENTGGESGGIYCEKASLVITDCIISKNTGGKSGGIYCEKASLVITDCIISKNTGEWSGGIWCAEGSLDITGCTITGNSAEWWGGGISCVFFGSTTITNCIITGNSGLVGGGICGYSPFISDCIIAGNSAERGGGIFCGSGNTTITNCIITGNLANEHGGGILIGGSDHTTIVNCTFAGNSALNGNALACDSYEQCYPSDLFIMNSILWDGGNEIWNNDGSTISINYSDVQGGYTGEENIDADPCFVELGYWDTNGTPYDVNDDFWVDGDYHLLEDSPCIDAGADVGVYDDIEGNVRPFDYPGVDNNGELPEFDMGAYEAVYINTTPVACIMGGDRVIEVGSGCEAKVTLDGSCSSDADSTAGANDDIKYFDWYEVIDPCDPNSDIFLGSGEIIDCNLSLGEHDIILEVIDKADAFDTNEVIIIVEDTTPPEFALSVTPDVLWPVNHKMVKITPSWEVSDNCDESPEVTLVSITSNEDDDAKGDGHTTDDIKVIDGNIYLRAERSGTGTGRIYTITYQAIDDSGNVTVESATVTVPHDQD